MSCLSSSVSMGTLAFQIVHSSSAPPPIFPAIHSSKSGPDPLAFFFFFLNCCCFDPHPFWEVVPCLPQPIRVLVSEFVIRVRNLHGTTTNASPRNPPPTGLTASCTAYCFFPLLSLKMGVNQKNLAEKRWHGFWSIFEHLLFPLHCNIREGKPEIA